MIAADRIRETLQIEKLIRPMLYSVPFLTPTQGAIRPGPSTGQKVLSRTVRILACLSYPSLSKPDGNGHCMAAVSQHTPFTLKRAADVVILWLPSGRPTG